MFSLEHIYNCSPHQLYLSNTTYRHNVQDDRY